jgi:hypothetical protein
MPSLFISGNSSTSSITYKSPGGPLLHRTGQRKTVNLNESRKSFNSTCSIDDKQKLAKDYYIHVPFWTCITFTTYTKCTPLAYSGRYFNLDVLSDTYTAFPRTLAAIFRYYLTFTSAGWTN